MLFRYHTEPAKLLRLFRRFRDQARRLREHRRRQGRWLLAAAVVYGLLTPALASLPGAAGARGLFVPLLGAGTALVVLGSGILAWSAAAPRPRLSPGQRGAWTWFGLIALAVPGLLLFDTYTDPATTALLHDPARLPALAALWAWAGIGTWLASRWSRWRRLAHVQAEEFELDYLDRVLRPLLRDLPADASCSLACNPFQAHWTIECQETKRGAYLFRGYVDTLLRFKAQLGGGASVELRTLHRRVDKFKQTRKKLKDKGSKHLLVQSYRLEHPALGRLSPADGERFRTLETAWRTEAAGFTSTPRRDPAAGRLLVVQKKKFAAPRDLAAGDLPPPALVLGTVRALSGFAAPAIAAARNATAAAGRPG